MVLFSRFSRVILLMGLLFVGIVTLVPASALAALQCECGCSLAGRTISGGPDCRANADCTQATCAAYCSGSGGPGTVPAVLTGSRVYRCSEATPVTETPTPTPAPSGSGGGTTVPATSGAGATTAGGAAATGEAPSSGSALRFTLPSCTSDGRCTLTDIINTGVRFANFLLALSGIVFLGTFLYAGAQLLFFAYDAKAIGNAQKMITGAFVGIVIIMVAGVGVRFVSSSLGVSSSTTSLPGTSTRTPTNFTGSATPATPAATVR